MTSEMQTALQAAEASYARDTVFRRYVDSAVHEAMRHAEHFDSEVDKRDLHHVAVVAAMAALRQAIEGNDLLKTMELQRDAAIKQAENIYRQTPSIFPLSDPSNKTT